MGRGSWTAIRTIPPPEWTNPLADGQPVPKRPCHQNNSKNCKNCHSEKIFFLNHAKKNSWMISLIPRSLNTRKKASGLFCIPPHPSHGSEILWKIPHLSSHPSLTKPHSRPTVIPEMWHLSTPLSVLEPDLLNRTGPNSWCQYVWSIQSYLVADILEKQARTRYKIRWYLVCYSALCLIC